MSLGNSHQYRADIDGLRALAVLCVIFFHYEIRGFKGGFVGVDVFFVISGFLITRLIRAEMEAQKFSFTNFYLRRMRRILPALFATCLVTTLAASILFLPQDLERFGTALASACFAVSNFFFWREAGYFDVSATSKPLLHTWSLSIEEQFYFLWPAFLLLLTSRKMRFLRPGAILLVGVVSLVLSQYWLRVDGQAAFYLLPFRAFEFAFGALSVWLLRVRPNHALLRELMLLAGLSVILYTVHGFRADSGFPGWRAAIPCLGTTLVILADAPRYGSKLLANKLAVAIGLISYSLYLVHWPLFVMYKYYVVDALTNREKIILIAASLGLAYVSYRFVETPLRRPKGAFNHRSYVLGCAAVGAFLALVGIYCRVDHGAAWRYGGIAYQQLNLSTEQLNEYVWTEHRARNSAFPMTGAKRVLVVGDSQAADLVNLLTANGDDRGIELRTLPILTDCQSVIPPSDGYDHIDNAKRREECIQALHAFKTDPRIQQADLVVIAARWTDWGLSYIDATIAHLTRDLGRPVVLWGQKNQVESGTVLVRRGARRGTADATALEANARLARVKGAVFVNPLSAFCTPDNSCEAFTEHNAVVFFDTHHVTPAGARYLAEKLKRAGAFDPILR